MQITEVKVRRLLQGSAVQAIVSVIIDNQLAIHDIKIIKTADRLFIAMPSQTDNNNGNHRDVVHPIDKDTREYMEKVIIQAYKEFINA